MKIVFKNEVGTTIAFDDIRNFDELVAAAESHKDYGVYMHADDLHDDNDIKNMMYDLQEYADQNNWGADD